MSPPSAPEASRPRIPTPEEAAEYHPAQDLLLGFLDAVSEAAIGRPLRPRMKLTPAGLLRGEIDVVKIELPAYAVAGLVIDRFAVRAERVRLVPGVPPRLRANHVGIRAIVTQHNVDRWTSDLGMPVRLKLTPEGVVTTTGIGGIRMTEVVTLPEAAGRFLRLQPQRASLLGVPAPMVRVLRGYLALPPLPRGAVLEEVSPSDGEMAITFRIEQFEQALTPTVSSRLRQVLDLPLPGL